VFYRVPVELKPTAADFRSIVLVNLLAKHIRGTQAAGHTGYTVTEMLPDLDQLWLTDRHGQRYSSELRIVAYDGLTEDQKDSLSGFRDSSGPEPATTADDPSHPHDYEVSLEY
jgi:hypothetical protein